MAVGICGAYDGLTGHIREFLDRVPVIERCNTVLWSNSDSFDIHNVRRLLFCSVPLISDVSVDGGQDSGGMLFYPTFFL